MHSISQVCELCSNDSLRILKRTFFNFPTDSITISPFRFENLTTYLNFYQTIHRYSHLTPAVAWREKKSKHFVFYKYFSLVLGLLKSRISEKIN